MAKGFWTETRIKLLRAMWSEGELSASEIARELGCTRNAVIGKANRLGLEWRDYAEFARRTMSDLDWNAVEEIRKAPRTRGSIARLAAKFGASAQSIKNARYHRTWRAA
jgi:GcrA cell cycle regulator